MKDEQSLDLITRMRNADKLQKDSQKQELITLIIEEIERQQKCQGSFRCKSFSLNVVFPVTLLLAQRSIAIHVEYPVSQEDWEEDERLLIYWHIPTEEP